MPKSEKFQHLPAPWDRIFSLATRVFVWALLIAILYILRPFFLLIFLTFVFAYVQGHGVEGLQHRFKSRVYRVLIVFLVFLGVIIGTVYFLAPNIQDQTRTFFNNWKDYKKEADVAIYEWTEDLPALRKLLVDWGEAEKAKGADNGEGAVNALDAVKRAITTDRSLTEEQRTKALEALDAVRAATDPRPRDAKDAGQNQSPDGKREEQPVPEIIQRVVNELIGLGGVKNGEQDLKKAVDAILGTVTSLLGFTSSFLLSILFSFLIVLDLPKLSARVAGLANTRLDFIYEEVADNIHDFATVLGRALEAQLLIAICNTILTAIGISIMGFENIVFLSTIVFFCSFIPVAGVFISSGPICLLALQSGGPEVSGIQMMLIAIAMILLIHFIEAYFLNPKIFGHHLRMNAVLVLIVLTIGGKVFGVWGLILGLPVVNYVFVTAIRRPEVEPEAVKG